MKTTPVLLPKYSRLLATTGEQIKMARLRRRLSAELVAERAGISRKTLINIEQGNPGVAVGNLLMVLMVLGQHQDFANIAANDVLGQKLMDAGLVTKKRAPKMKNPD
jgi:transcriptional regulator with XRE-family HTH domain